jgi:peptide/nickel transport system substrate-binding protein
MLLAAEPTGVAWRGFKQSSANIRAPQRIFNALPALIDGRGLPRPELLVGLPALNTDTWQVFPDGTMRTTYTLRPNLTWHDGQPLTADDFVFSWRVYSNPELGLADQPPMSAISEVAAIDREHFTIHWRVPYPDAETLSLYSRELPAVPQHILGTLFEQMPTNGRDSFFNHPFWGTQFVGLGPYRVNQWEPGAFIEAVRFDGYALGAPKIARVQLRFSVDQNVVMANLLAGEAHVAMDSAIPQTPTALIQEWSRTGAGTVFRSPTSWQEVVFQLRPDIANPRVILDPRVRKAVAHAVDKHTVNEAIYDGQGVLSDGPVWSGSEWGAALDDAIPAYSFDLRATERWMSQAGLSKGSDGFYRGPDGRLSLELAISESPDSVRQILVMADGLRSAGLNVEQRVIPRVLSQDAELRATFPAMYVVGVGLGEVALNSLASSQIASPATRWQGFNRGGWSSPEYDQLLKTFNTTLDRGERVGLVRQMLRVYAEEVPSFGLFFPAQAFGYVTELTGPAPRAPETNSAWNIYEWEFR